MNPIRNQCMTNDMTTDMTNDMTTDMTTDMTNDMTNDIMIDSYVMGHGYIIYCVRACMVHANILL